MQETSENIYAPVIAIAFGAMILTAVAAAIADPPPSNTTSMAPPMFWALGRTPVIAVTETLEAVVICANLESAIAAAASISALTMFVTVADALSTRAWKSALPELSGNVVPLVKVTVAMAMLPLLKCILLGLKLMKSRRL